MSLGLLFSIKVHINYNSSEKYVYIKMGLHTSPPCEICHDFATVWFYGKQSIDNKKIKQTKRNENRLIACILFFISCYLERLKQSHKLKIEFSTL